MYSQVSALKSAGARSRGLSPSAQESGQQQYQPRHSGHRALDASGDKATIREFDSFVKFMTGVTIVCILLTICCLRGWAMATLLFVLMVCGFSFYFASYLVRWIISKSSGTPEMQDIADRIKEGSEGYLTTQYWTIATMAIVVAISLLFIYLFRSSTSSGVSQPVLAIVTAFAFCLGSACSAAAGYTGVWTSVRVNIRVSAAAAAGNDTEALLLAFRGGAVSAILSAAMCITGLSFLYIVSQILFVQWMNVPEQEVPMLLGGYGFGASFVALFMQLGGGIYTKAADVGADMVGKVEKSIPEDDPRNPAVIADLVGDNVGDCAGSMADVFESIAGEIIGTMILGGSLAEQASAPNPQMFIFFPLIIHALDLVVSSIGIMCVKPRSNEEPMKCMLRGYLVALFMALIFFAIFTKAMLQTPDAPNAWRYYFACGIVGLLTSYVLILITQYYTDYIHAPVKRIVEASKSGHGTNVIAGVAVGLESCGGPSIVIAIALLSSYTLGKNSGLPAHMAGLFGTAVATMGMLCTAVFILSMNNFGPIADNAGGIVEMSGQDQRVRAITDRLDAVGNVTKAATKGYAVGGSALACFLLFQAFLDEISVLTKTPFETVDITKVEVMIGGLLGIMMVFLFSGFAIRAVGVTAQAVVEEVRRQFRSNPGIMTGQSKPDYNRAVTIVTQAALGQMVKPALLALLTPITVGLIFRVIGGYSGRKMLGVEVLASFLMFGTLTGLLLAIFFDNSGGAWDNAKKLVEKGEAGGKGSLAHQAAVTGDTVGDPFKDTAGPSLHVIITTMSTTALVLGPIFIANVATANNAVAE